MKVSISPNELIKLPKYQERKAGLVERGRPWEWILDTVALDDNYAVFLKLGKPWYRSECPHYEGYWLSGGIGSVQCSVAEGLLPGIHQLLYCGSDCKNCPVYNLATEQQENKKE